MGQPPRAFYSVIEAAARWDCTPADIVGWAAVGEFDLVAAIPWAQCGIDTVGGVLVISAADVMSLFQQYGMSPSVCRIRRIREPDTAAWRLISEPSDGIEVGASDLMITGAEVRRIEKEWGFSRRQPGGDGPSPKYDWDAFYLAVIVRIYHKGLPQMLVEFVREMQDWFIANSEGADCPDESTIRRRINPIWRELRER